MSFFASPAYSATRAATRSYSAISTAGARSFASSSRLAAPSPSAPASASAPAPAPSSSAGPSKSASTLPPSSCPAGTPLPGLAILKDRPEPIALPDEEYPPWLWSLLATPALKTTSASTEAGDAGPSSGGGGGAPSGGALTKGQLRVQQKREFREKRAANAAAARAARNAGALKGKGSNRAAQGTAPPTTSEEMGRVEASVAEEEKEKKTALRKANREAIKGKNFVKAS